MKVLAIGAVTGLLLLSPTVSHAQETPPNPINENACVIELGVANRYGVTGTTGFLGTMLGGGLLGTLAVNAANKDGNEKRKTELMEVISPEYIKSVFIQTDLVSRIKSDALQINYYDLPDDKKVIKTMLNSSKRRSEAANACYYEIFIKDIELIRHITQSNLSVSFAVKKFSGADLLSIKNDTITAPTSAFPAKDPAKQSEASNRVQESFKVTVKKLVEKRFN